MLSFSITVQTPPETHQFKAKNVSLQVQMIIFFNAEMVSFSITVQTPSETYQLKAKNVSLQV